MLNAPRIPERVHVNESSVKLLPAVSADAADSYSPSPPR